MGQAAFAPSRRAVLTGVAAVAAAGCAALPAVAGTLPAAASGRGAREVVSFHMDQPFLDLSGQGKPFTPPTGVAVQLPDAVFLHHPYL